MEPKNHVLFLASESDERALNTQIPRQGTRGTII
jgi:hypothetical protein